MEQGLVLVIVNSDRWVVKLIITHRYMDRTTCVTVIILSCQYFFLPVCIVNNNVTIGRYGARFFWMQHQVIVLVSPMREAVLR